MNTMKTRLLCLVGICSVLLVIDFILLSFTRSHHLFRPTVSKREGSKVHSGSRRRHGHHVQGIESNSEEEEEELALPFNSTLSLSEHPKCTPDLARRRLQNLIGPKFLSDLPVFVDKNFLSRPDTMKFSLPFGFKETEAGVRDVLEALPDKGLPGIAKEKSCLRCVIVGSGGILLNKKLGPVIDNFDIVIRLNRAPVINFEKDVGAKTSIRLTYPEGSFPAQEHFTPDWLMAVMAFKPLDLVWLKTVSQGNTMEDGKGFWGKLPLKVNKKANEFRLFNPDIVMEAANIIGYKIEDGKIEKSVPTTGFIAIITALKFCDEIMVAGFGYDHNHPKMRLHYYDSLNMGLIKNSRTHDITLETKMLVKFAEQGIIHDLTDGISVY